MQAGIYIDWFDRGIRTRSRVRDGTAAGHDHVTHVVFSIDRSILIFQIYNVIFFETSLAMWIASLRQESTLVFV